MHKSGKFLIITLLFCAFGTILYLYKKPIFSFKTQKVQKTAIKKTDQDLPEITIQNFNIKEFNKDRKDIWILTSKEGKIFKKLNIIECFDTLCFFKKDDQEIAVLKSGKSLFDQNNKNLFLIGPVTGNFKNLEFYGYDLNYNVSEHKIETKKEIIYLYPHFRLCAKESTFKIKENTIEMRNGITTEISNNSTSNNSTN